MTKLANEDPLRGAIEALGGVCVERARADWPRAIIGTAAPPTGPAPAWRLYWEGWRGGVIPATWATTATDEAIALAPAMAAAACVGEVFDWHAGDHDMAGRRASGLSIWKPGGAWVEPDSSEPKLRYLPTQLWLIGLGNLCQAFAWVLASLSYP